MKVPPGMTLHHGSRRYDAGADLPPELEALLPEDIRLQALEAETRPGTPVAADAKPERRR